MLKKLHAYLWISLAQFDEDVLDMNSFATRKSSKELRHPCQPVPRWETSCMLGKDSEQRCMFIIKSQQGKHTGELPPALSAITTHSLEDAVECIGSPVNAVSLPKRAIAEVAP